MASAPQDRYKLIRMVGKGGFGSVYKAKRIMDGDLVAVKIIKMLLGENYSLIMEEISTMKSCIHPNIVEYFESFIRSDEHMCIELWICMEYCGSGSLHHIYTNTRALSELEIAYACKETLKGLAYLHSQPMIHRDIKGANILVTAEGNVKLADFGLSAKISDSMKTRKTPAGTTYWMAPEVFKDSKMGGYNQQCDIWSVGITAIELAECTPPRSNLNDWEFVKHVIKAKAPTLSSPDQWSSCFHHFVKVALTKNPAKRPTAEKLLKDKFLKGDLTKNLLKDLLDDLKRKDSSSIISYDSDVVASPLSEAANVTQQNVLSDMAAAYALLYDDLFDSQLQLSNPSSYNSEESDSTDYVNFNSV